MNWFSLFFFTQVPISTGQVPLKLDPDIVMVQINHLIELVF